MRKMWIRLLRTRLDGWMGGVGVGGGMVRILLERTQEEERNRGLIAKGSTDPSKPEVLRSCS